MKKKKETPKEKVDRYLGRATKSGLSKNCAHGWHLVCKDTQGTKCVCPCHPVLRAMVREMQAEELIP